MMHKHIFEMFHNLCGIDVHLKHLEWRRLLRLIVKEMYVCFVRRKLQTCTFLSQLFFCSTFTIYRDLNLSEDCRQKYNQKGKNHFRIYLVSDEYANSSLTCVSSFHLSCDLIVFNMDIFTY